MEQEKTNKFGTVFSGIFTVLGAILGLVIALVSLAVATPFFLFAWVKNWIISGLALTLFYYFGAGIPLMLMGYISHPYDHMTEMAIYIIIGLSGIASLVATIGMFREA